jgi:tungstate transport system ATP-binding protein
MHSANVLSFPAATPEQRITLEKITLNREGQGVFDQLCVSFSASGLSIVMGPNGAGKTSLLRLLTGLETPQSGQMTLPAGRTSLVFQRPVLLRRSVAGNLAYVLRLNRVPRALRPMRLAALLTLAQLTDQAQLPAHRLSGGAQQRLAFARALANDPTLLLLDEPCAHLDPASTAQIERLIRHALEQGTKVILVTHDIAQARRLGGEITFLSHGRAVEQAPAARFFTSPQSAESRAYLTGHLEC